jgi:hypothetical protein
MEREKREEALNAEQQKWEKALKVEKEKQESDNGEGGFTSTNF